ncbi:MAG: hypothetical protein R2713_06585 [Ilumatobacteraceae bacterium]
MKLIEHRAAGDAARLDRHRPVGDGTCVEEILRWATVTMHFRRTAMRDVEMHGKQIKAGDKVVIGSCRPTTTATSSRIVPPSTSPVHRTSTWRSGG